jgi:hypothetical protein
MEGGKDKETKLFTKRSVCTVCSSDKFCEHKRRLAGACLQCGRSTQKPSTKRTLKPETARA